jgi:hypothetical protein
MAYEQNDMTFSLFPNKDRKTDKHANMTGKALIDGVSYFVDGWVNLDRNGNKYISGKFKPMQPREGPPQQRADYRGNDPNTSGTPDIDDDQGVPF